MKNIFIFLFSLMLMVSINAMGATGASHEGETNSVVLQTFDSATFEVIAVNSFIGITTLAIVQNQVPITMSTLDLSKSVLTMNELAFIQNRNFNTEFSHYSFKDPGRLSYTSLISFNYNSNSNNIRAVSFKYRC